MAADGAPGAPGAAGDAGAPGSTPRRRPAAPNTAWSWTLRGGAIAQAVVGMLLVTADRSGIRPEVSRDILIVGVLGLVVAMLVAVLTPTAGGSKVVRRVMLGAIALATFVTLAGVLAQAVTPWTVVPAGVLVLGMVLLYRDVKAGKTGTAGAPGGFGASGEAPRR